MILKKIVIGLFFASFLGGCAQNIAYLGPAYSLATSGNVYHVGLSYGSNEVIIKTTGKSTSQNIKEILNPKKKDTEFEKMVKKRVRDTRKKLNLPNQ